MSGTPKAVTQDHLQALAARTGDCIAEVAETAAGAIEEVAADIPGQMTGATAQAAGTAGIVPAPAAGDNTKFLRGDGTWNSLAATLFQVSTSDPSSSGCIWIKAQSLS